MSSWEPQSKKRRLDTDSGIGNGILNTKERFKPTSARDWTISIAVPTSIITSCVTREQRTTAAGSIARALAIFSVDEVVIFDDSPIEQRPRNFDPDAYTGDIEPAHFLEHLLNYLETPPFMRKVLFPIHPNLKSQGLLHGLDMPHHPHKDEWLPYREGLTLEAPPRSGKPEPVNPAEPRTEGGYFWGYSVRKAKSLSDVFTSSAYEDGYDLSIGTSERGVPLSKAFPNHNQTATFNHMLIVFGGPRGLEFAAMNDPDLGQMGIQGARTKELFDHWVNVLPNQGTRGIRTDESLLIALTALRRLWDNS
uniref:Deoxyribose-phosphate aldolase n=1 Tax=Podospora anserina (strain S / ATCC MYA-4624 / DSM 980 / FGSC 10383) TaxID=515849 RepID=A0A090D4E4_PODAN|nr:Putative protein of unknown function [Podospora anserina S mat+]